MESYTKSQEQANIKIDEIGLLLEQLENAPTAHHAGNDESISCWRQ